MTPPDHTDLRALMERATALPWHHRQAGILVKGYEADWAGDAPDGEQHSKIIVQRFSFHGGSVDYAFVVAAVNALPSLLAKAEALDAAQAEIARLRGALRSFVEWFGNAGDHAGDAGCDYLNEGGWEDLAAIGEAARAALSPATAEAGEVDRG